MILKDNQIEFIKYLAIILMCFDHYATIYLDSFHIFKILGRIVFPLFAFILVYNYIYNTSNKKQYILRLFIFAIISQPFYYFAFNDFFQNKIVLNIFFSLSIGLLIIYLNELFLINKKLIEKIIFNSLLFVFIFIISIFLSYKIFGIILIVSIYLFLKKNSILNFILLILSIYLLNFLWEPFLSLFSLSSLILIYFISKINYSIKRINKWIFYIFYPIHLIILKFI